MLDIKFIRENTALVKEGIKNKNEKDTVDRILELDSRNPQIASRLTTPFSTWKRYDTSRQKLIKTELQRIVDKDGLSGDVFEMVRRSLDG